MHILIAFHYILSLLKALNGLAQLIMGPLDIDKDEHKSFLNVVNLLIFSLKNLR